MKIKFVSIAFWSSFSALLLSCEESPCSCPECPQCAPLPTCQWSDLDAQTREHLKQELADALKDEMRARWHQDFEAESRAKWEAEYAKSPSSSASKETAFREKNEDSQALDHELDRIKPDPLPPTQALEEDVGGMEITRHIFTTRVEHRLPVSDRESFSISDGAVFCYVEISSPEERDRMITIRFIHSTGLSQSYTLPVSQSPSWRTWTKLNLTRSMTGTWLCEVFNEDHALLASRPFVVVD